MIGHREEITNGHGRSLDEIRGLDRLGGISPFPRPATAENLQLTLGIEEYLDRDAQNKVLLVPGNLAAEWQMVHGVIVAHGISVDGYYYVELPQRAENYAENTSIAVPAIANSNEYLLAAKEAIDRFYAQNADLFEALLNDLPIHSIYELFAFVPGSNTPIFLLPVVE